MTRTDADGLPSLVPGGFRILKGQKTSTTLAERGRALPVVPLDGSYRFQPIDLKFRVMINREVERNLDLRNRLGQRIIRAAALSLTDFGPDWKGKSIDAKCLALGQLSVADIQFLAYVRIAEEYGTSWRRTVHLETCPHCRQALPRQVDVDIGQMYVEAWDRPPVAEYMLLHPWRLNGIDVKTVQMQSPRVVRALEPMTDEDFEDDLTRQLVWLAASITGVNGQPMVVNWDQLDGRDQGTGRAMHLDDFDELNGLIDQLLGGPAGAVGWTHPACGGEVPILTQWGAAFFGRSGA